MFSGCLLTVDSFSTIPIFPLKRSLPPASTIPLKSRRALPLPLLVNPSGASRTSGNPTMTKPSAENVNVVTPRTRATNLTKLNSSPLVMLRFRNLRKLRASVVGESWYCLGLKSGRRSWRTSLKLVKLERNPRHWSLMVVRPHQS